jgi:non-lysosomal glucosylceramidase
VSRWKDLGPKFVLQIYRDYIFMKDTLCRDNADLDAQMEAFLRDMYPVLLTVMVSTQQFDADGDGMIENGGFPDQTYDIWTATGVHAYCGGLWIAACEATSAVGAIMKDEAVRARYSELATRARHVYVSRLWNGEYLDYDSSRSGHHDSVMADMLAGQWYAHACHLPPVVTPQQALSCFRTIYRLNVVAFGAGRFLGAVNGMKPNGRVDNCCLQSREVWTGTTYALAAGMLHEAMVREGSDGPSLTAEERLELQSMSHNTARGIHDAGWVDFGYWFATPEAWERSGNYRSLGYMRPLSIWAIQYAKERGATKGVATRDTLEVGVREGEGEGDVERV